MTSNYWWHQLFGKSGFCGHQKRSCRNIGGRHSCPVGLGKCGVEVENPKAGLHTNNSWKKKSCVFATDFNRQKKYVQVSVHIFFLEKKEYHFRYTKNFRNKRSTDFGTDFNRQKKGVPFLIFCISFLPRCEIRNHER